MTGGEQERGPARPQGAGTRAVHAGERRPGVEGAVVLPVFQTAQYEFGATEREGLRYVRLGNTPNHLALGAKLAALENAPAAVFGASGMAAISAALLCVLESGDHVLTQRTLYGGTDSLFADDFPRLGIAVDRIDADDPSGWEARLRPTTKVLYLETLSNPLCEVPDLEAAVRFARAHGLVSMIDNTFASPLNFRPIERGFDLSLHSATKYLNGHSDVVAGAAAGAPELVERVRRKLLRLGGALDPHACFLLQRGMKTLPLRMRQHERNALALARALEESPAVARVCYPGLPSHPSHARAQRFLDGCSGMLAFEPEGGLEATEAFFERVRIALAAPSLGGLETLLSRPANTSHAGMPRAEREALGIGDALVRVSVGVEDADDLVADFLQALG